MDKKLLIGVVAGAALATAGMVLAGRTLTRPTYGEVVRVHPRVEQVNAPREVCRDVTSTRYVKREDNLNNGTLIGALVGGAIGNRHGGSHRDAATVVGAVAGGFAGREIDRRKVRSEPVTTTTRQCRTVAEVQERVAGYDVTYEVDGDRRTVYMDRDPGDRVRLAEVEAIAERAADLAAR
ncbi:MAG TPA: glycine zipper 2TM domain-containing protein [Xanthomonadales bacterium]|nr:glycine zipper 2TM domain-containing protein [Xanthomonadales bacterium]